MIIEGKPMKTITVEQLKEIYFLTRVPLLGRKYDELCENLIKCGIKLGYIEEPKNEFLIKQARELWDRFVQEVGITNIGIDVNRIHDAYELAYKDKVEKCTDYIENPKNLIEQAREKSYQYVDKINDHNNLCLYNNIIEMYEAAYAEKNNFTPTKVQDYLDKLSHMQGVIEWMSMLRIWLKEQEAVLLHFTKGGPEL